MPLRSVENQLTIWGIISLTCAGLLFTVPGFNAVTIAAAMISLTLVVTRLGFSRSIVVAMPGMIACFVISSLTIGYQAGIELLALFILSAVMPSMLMGWGARRLEDPSKIVIYGLLPFAVVLIMFAGIYLGIMADLPAVIDKFNSDLRLTVGQYSPLQSLIERAFPPAEGSVDRFLESYDKILTGTLKIIPAILILGFLGMVLVSIAGAGIIAARLGIIFPRFRPFYLWRAGGWWLLLTVAGLIPVVFSGREAVFYGGVNLLIITGHVYFVVGLSIVESYFRRLYNPRPVRFLFYGILLFLGIFAFSSAVLTYAGLVLLVFLIALGLSDSRFNYNRESVETNE